MSVIIPLITSCTGEFQVEGTADHSNKSDMSSPSRKGKVVLRQDSVNNGEHFSDCNSENTLDEPDVTINATSPPDDIKKHVHQLLKYVKGKRVDISKEESVVSMDMWDFAGQHLYYASHPLFLSPRALYILVHNHSKPLHAPAQPCVRQGTCDIYLENPNNETNLENLLSWLATIHSVTQLQVKEETADEAQGKKLPYLPPPVIIVGTHADKPFEDIAVMKSQIQKKISGKKYEKHVVRPFFSIDNTSSLMRNKIKRFFGQVTNKRKHQAGIEVHVKLIDNQ